MISDKNLPGQLRAVQGKIARKRREIETFERQHEQDGWDGREDLQGYESMSNTLNSELNALESEYKEILAKMRKQRPSDYFTNCENPKKKLAILTPEEDKDWENAYISNLEEGLDDDEADEAAWTELKEMHPRLQEFEGIDEKRTRMALKSNPITLPPKHRPGPGGYVDFPHDYDKEVHSDTSDRTYMVRKRGDNWTCTCPSFIFNKKDPRTCKHIEREKEAGYQEPETTPNTWNDLSVSERVTIVRRKFPNLGPDGVINLANTKWDRIPEAKRQALLTMKSNPNTKYTVPREVLRELKKGKVIMVKGYGGDWDNYTAMDSYSDYRNQGWSDDDIMDTIKSYKDWQWWGEMIKSQSNPARWSITYFDPETDEGQEKTWTFNTLQEAKEFQKDLSTFWKTSKAKIPINWISSNPGFMLPHTKPGTIEDLMLHRAVIEEVTRRPYRVDKEMGKRLINPKQRAPDPTSMQDVRNRLMSKGPQNFSLKRVVQGQEAQGILEAIVMDLYGGIPLLGDSNDLIRTTRIIKTTGSPLKAQIHSLDTLLGTQGIPLVDMIPIVGGLLSTGGGEIADFLLPANTIGFIIEPPQENPLTASELLAGLTAAGIVTGIAMGGASAIGSQLIDRGMKGVEKELKKNPVRKGRAAYYRWGEFSDYEQFDMKELDSMVILDEHQMQSMNVIEDHEGWTFYAYESDIDEDANGVSIKNAYAMPTQNPVPLVVHGAAIAAPRIAKAAKPHAKKATRELKKRAKKFRLSNPPKLPPKKRYEPGIIKTSSGARLKVKKTMIIPEEPRPELKYPTIPPLVQRFMPPHQARIVRGNMAEFQDVMERLNKQITDCPSTGQTEGTDDPIAYLHYFYGNADWYIIEKDMEEEQHQAFGYADLGMGFPELGYISIEEIKETNKVELDFHWKPIPLSNIKEKHEARGNVRQNGFEYMGDIISGIAQGISGVASEHGAKEFSKEEMKVQRAEARAEKKRLKALKKSRKNPLTKIDHAENGIRDLFLDRHYSGTVPRTDIKTMLTSKKLQRYYGHGNINKAWKNLVREGYVHKSGENWIWGINNPLSAFAVPIAMGVVSGVTGVIASTIMKDQLEKHNNRRKNPKVAIEQYKAFQQMDPKNSDQGGRIADMVSPVTIIGQIKHVVYQNSKWSGEEFEKRENVNVQYIHTWKRNRMDLCRDRNGDYFISGKCQIEPRGIDDWDKKVDWSDSKIDYPHTAKNYAFLGLLKEIAVKDGDIYTMKDALLCGRNNHLFIAYVSPSVFEKIKKEYKLK